MTIAPDITHYHGRMVTGIETEGGGWQIVLEGDAKIVSLDPEYEAPSDVLVGMAFVKTEMSRGMTKLWFGTEDNPFATVMNFNPTKYGISDPGYENGEVYRPQAGYAPAAVAGDLPTADAETDED